MIPEIKWGVLQAFELEADTDSSLVAAMVILTSYHSKITHYKVVVKDDKPALHLMWFTGTNENAIEFLTPLVTPEQKAAEVKRWLENIDYPEDPYALGDGSSKKGYKISMDRGYTVAIIEPTWVYYGK